MSFQVIKRSPVLKFSVMTMMQLLRSPSGQGALLGWQIGFLRRVRDYAQVKGDGTTFIKIWLLNPWLLWVIRSVRTWIFG